ncbi:fucolectin-1-like, partial [Ylistrum balloti]|uniref:fucolectin-1-like n=1 Tax=Ylistrum balloti TaxID=509963 RepID=UPI002905C79F
MIAVQPFFLKEKVPTIKSVQICSALRLNLCRQPDIKTSQSSNYSATSISEKAVDGRTDQKFSSGSCIHTQTTPALSEAWWRIDLGGPVVIEHVKIYYRNDSVHGQSRRFGGFQIYLSNTTDWRNGDNCHTDTTSTWQSMDLAPSIQSCTGNTIYLTIYVDRRPNKPYTWYSDYAILELCEVEIYACVNGNYGSFCDTTCPDNCKDGVCDQHTGECE